MIVHQDLKNIAHTLYQKRLQTIYNDVHAAIESHSSPVAKKAVYMTEFSSESLAY